MSDSGDSMMMDGTPGGSPSVGGGGVGFGEAIRRGFGINREVFQGRASRSQYWFWALFTILLYLVVAVVFVLLLGAMAGSGGKPSFGRVVGFMFVDVIYCAVMLATFIPSYVLMVRRMHDLGYSGWLLLVTLIPIIGGLGLLVAFCMRGTVGPNRFGPDPLV